MMPAAESSSVEQEAIRALETVLSPLASSSERAAANQYCERLKEDVGGSLQLALTFFPHGRGYNMAVRQFGLNLLESVAKRLGQGASASQEQAFLEQLWSIAFGPTGLSGQESDGMKEKLAGIVVQAALRVWPQRWSGLFDQLQGEMQCLETGPADARQALNAELALGVVRLLVEELQQATNDDSAWDSVRRQELQSAQALVLPGFTIWVAKALPATAGRSRPDDAASMACVSACVRTWGGLMPAVGLPEAPHSLLALGTLFNIAQVYTGRVRDESLEALLAFSARPLRTGEDAILASLLDQEAERFEHLLTAFIQAASQENSDDDEWEEAYVGAKRTAEILVNLCIATIGQKKKAILPKNQLSRLLNLHLSLLGTPSLLLRSLASLFWRSALAGKEHDVWQGLLPTLFHRILGALATSRKADRKHRWNRADFDSEADFEEVFAAGWNRLQCLLEAMALKHSACIGLMGEAIASFCSDPSNAAILSGTASSTLLFTTQIQALGSACDAVCRGLARCLQVSEALAPARSLLEGLTSSSIVFPGRTHTETLLAWLSLVRPVAVLVATHSQVVAVPPSLIPGMLGLAMSYSLEGDIEGAVRVRGRASAFLLKLASCAPGLFPVELTEELLRAAETSLGVQQRRFITELLLLLHGGRVDVLDRAVRPVLVELEDAGPLLLSPTALKAFATQPEERADARKALCNLLALTFILATKLPSSDGTADYVRGTLAPRLLGCLFGLLGALKEVAKPEFWPPSESALWAAIFSPASNDATNVLAAFDPILTDPAVPSTSACDPSSIRAYFSSVTVSAMVSVGYLAGHAVDARSIEALWTPYLATWDPASSSLSSLTWLLKHILHPLLLLPDNSVLIASASFGPAWDRFLLALCTRLVTEYSASSVPARSTSEELERETELHQLSTALLSLLYDTLFPQAERNSRVEPFLDLANGVLPAAPPSTSPTAQWLAHGNQDRMVLVLRLISAAINWPASTGVSKMFVLALRWLPLWAQRAPPAALLAPSDPSTILAAALVCIGKPSASDFHPTACQLVGELYKWAVYLGVEQSSGIIPALSGLPAITPDALTTLRTALTTAPATSNGVAPAAAALKSHREATRSFFRPMQQATAAMAAGKASYIQRLPEKLLLIKKLKENEKVENEVSAEDIDALFA